MNEEQRRNELKALIDHVPVNHLDYVLGMLNDVILVDNMHCEACKRMDGKLSND